MLRFSALQSRSSARRLRPEPSQCHIEPVITQCQELKGMDWRGRVPAWLTPRPRCSASRSPSATDGSGPARSRNPSPLPVPSRLPRPGITARQLHRHHPSTWHVRRNHHWPGKTTRTSRNRPRLKFLALGCSRRVVASRRLRTWRPGWFRMTGGAAGAGVAFGAYVFGTGHRCYGKLRDSPNGVVCVVSLDATRLPHRMPKLSGLPGASSRRTPARVPGPPPASSPL